MSWTQSLPENVADGELKALFDAIRARSSRGSVSNLWRACAIDPRGVTALFGHYEALMTDPAPLSVSQAEMIALVVSATNGCAYCVAHHGPRLAQACGNELLAHAVALDYREANLAARDRVLLDAAVALTCEPAERKREDIERMREYGFDDVAIVKATEIAAYYNLVNRMVCALGIEPEAGLTPWSFGAQR
jgi:uncharacterized peroxidase-related enzyme